MGLKYTRYPLTLQNLAKRMSMSSKKLTYCDRDEIQAKDENENVKDGKANGDLNKNQNVSSTTHRRHRIAHIFFPRKNERSDSTNSRLQENYEKEAPKVLFFSSSYIDEKKIDK